MHGSHDAAPPADDVGGGLISGVGTLEWIPGLVTAILWGRTGNLELDDIVLFFTSATNALLNDFDGLLSVRGAQP